MHLITDIEEQHLNKMNRSSQDISLGTYLKQLGETSGSLGSMSSQSASAVSISGGTAVFGNTSNNTTFEPDGTMVMSGSATVWDDIFFPLVTAKQGQTDKPLFDATEVAYLFPPSDTSQLMYIVAQFPHSRKIGSNLSPHVHWKQTHSGSPVFKMDYKWFPISGSIPAAWGTHIMDTPAILYTSGSIHQLTHGDRISGSIIDESGVGVSSIMLIKLYRDDNAYSGNVVTYQFDIHYEKDTFGSRNEYIK